MLSNDKWFVQGSFYFALQYFCEFFSLLFSLLFIRVYFGGFLFFVCSTCFSQLKTQHTVYDTCNLHLNCKDSLQDNSRRSSRYSIKTLNFIVTSRREKDFLRSVWFMITIQQTIKITWAHNTTLMISSDARKFVCDFEITWKVSVLPAILAIVGT